MGLDSGMLLVFSGWPLVLGLAWAFLPLAGSAALVLPKGWILALSEWTWRGARLDIPARCQTRNSNRA